MIHQIVDRVFLALVSTAMVIALISVPLLQSRVESKGQWDGIYRVDGRNPNGTAYTGAVEVAKIPDTGFYSLRWLQDADPDQEAMLALAYEHDDLLVATGVNMVMLGSFKQKGEGRWVVPNVATPLSEKWERSKATNLRDALKPMPKPTGHPAPKPAERQASR